MRDRWPQVLFVLCLAALGSRLSKAAEAQLPPWMTPPPPAGIWHAELSVEGENRRFWLSVTASKRLHGDQYLYLFMGELRFGDLRCDFEQLEVPWPPTTADHLSFDCKTPPSPRRTSHPHGGLRRILTGGQVDLVFGRENREVTASWRQNGASTSALLHPPSQVGTSRYLGDWACDSSPLAPVLHIYENPEPVDPEMSREFLDEMDPDNLIATFDEPLTGWYGRSAGLTYGSKKDPDAIDVVYGDHVIWMERYDPETQEIRGAPGTCTLKRVKGPGLSSPAPRPTAE